jgi:hypothetical protein
LSIGKQTAENSCQRPAVDVIEARAGAVCGGQLGGYRSHCMPPAGCAGKPATCGRGRPSSRLNLNLKRPLPRSMGLAKPPIASPMAPRCAFASCWLTTRTPLSGVIRFAGIMESFSLAFVSPFFERHRRAIGNRESPVERAAIAGAERRNCPDSRCPGYKRPRAWARHSNLGSRKVPLCESHPATISGRGIRPPPMLRLPERQSFRGSPPSR